MRDPYHRPEGYEPPTSSGELLARYATGERYFEESDLPDESVFAGANLSGANFRNSWFFGAVFRGADLRQACFDACNVKCAEFDDANLCGATFRGAALESATVVGAQLDDVTVDGAMCYGGPLLDIHQLLPLDDPYHSLMRLPGAR